MTKVGNMQKIGQLEEKKIDISAYDKKFSIDDHITTAHGLNKFDPSTRRAVKIIWISVLLTAYACCTLQIVRSVQVYLQRPIKTTLQQYNEIQLEFPSVTICNENIIKKSKMNSLLEMLKTSSTFENSCVSGVKEDVDKEDSRSDYMKSNSDEHSKSCEYGYVENGKCYLDEEDFDQDSLCSDDADENLKHLLATHAVEVNKISSDDSDTNYGHLFNDTVLKCRWRGVDCLSDRFTRKYWQMFWHWKYGNCYRFNGGLGDMGLSVDGTITDHNKTIPLKVDLPGPERALKLTLDIQDEEYTSLSKSSSGIRVHIGERDHTPHIYTEGFSLSPGGSHHVSITKKIIIRADPFKNGSCAVSDRNNKYSAVDCKKTCLRERQKEECHCNEHEVDELTKEGTICKNSSQYQCAKRVRRQSSSKCGSDCKAPCKEVVYDYRISHSGYPGYMLNESEFQRVKATQLEVRIYYKDFNVQLITDEEYYLMENLLGDYYYLLLFLSYFIILYPIYNVNILKICISI